MVKNIAILSYFSGLNKRGVETWVSQLGERLSNFYSITVFQTGPVKKSKYSTVKIVNLPKRFNRENFNLRKRFFLDRQSLYKLIFSLKCIPFLIKGKYDLIIPTDGGWQSVFIRIFTFLLGKKMMVVGHSGIGWDDRFNLLCFPDVFVALSNYFASWAKKVNSFIKIKIVTNGVEISKFTPNGKRANLNLSHPIVLTVGALEKEKRIDLVIRAVSAIKNASLIMLGDGSEKNNILKLADNLLPGRYILKSVDNHNISEYYRVADVFTLPSWNREAFGLVYLEALSTGLSIVAPDDAIRREILRDCAVFTNPQNIKQYSKDLLKAYETKNNQKALSLAKEYSWEKVADRYRKIIEEL